MLTLAEPKITTPHSYYDPGRSRKITYVIDETETEVRTVQVSVIHHKDRKQFFAVANFVVQEKSDGIFSVEKYAPLDGVRLGSEPVARFSAKALDAYTARVVEAFPDLVKSEPRLQALFEKTEV